MYNFCDAVKKFGMTLQYQTVSKHTEILDTYCIKMLNQHIYVIIH